MPIFVLSHSSDARPPRPLLLVSLLCPRNSQSNVDIRVKWISQRLEFHRKFIDKEIFITRIKEAKKDIGV